MGTIVHICGQMSPVYREVDLIHSNVLSFDSVVSMKAAGAAPSLTSKNIFPEEYALCISRRFPSRYRDYLQKYRHQEGPDRRSGAFGKYRLHIRKRRFHSQSARRRNDIRTIFHTPRCQRPYLSLITEFQSIGTRLWGRWSLRFFSRTAKGKY